MTRRIGARLHMRRRTVVCLVTVLCVIGGLGPSVAQASAPPPTGCQPTACTPGSTVGLTNSQGDPVPAAATLYGWGQATMPDGSILVGDYWNYRIVHYNADGTPATPFVFSQSNFGFGPDTNQAPYGLCVDNSGGPFQGYVYMTEGSLFNVNQYDPDGNWVTSWGTNEATNTVAFDYPSECVVGPNGLVYIANQWGDKHNPPEADLVVLNPVTNKATFVSPTNSQYAFEATRSMAFDSAGDIWIANQGNHRIDVYDPSCLQNPWPTTGCLPIMEITPPGGVSTTFDMRGLAIDTTTNLAFVANGQNCLVQEFNADPTSPSFGAFVANFNGVAAGDSNCGTGNGQFEDGARDIAVSGDHQVWVGDLGYFRDQVFDESGNFQFVAPATPNPDLPPTGGFNGPRGVAFDSSGDMYVSDMFNERIEEFAPNGSGGYVYDREWGFRGDTDTTMNYPRLLCVDPQTGNLIVANTDSSTAVAWNVSVNPPREVWAYGALKSPYGLACSASGTVYVADSNDSDVVALTNSGTLLGTMGSAQNMGFVRGIWVDTSDGSVWVDTSATGKVFHFAQWSDGGGFLGSFNVNTSIPSAGVFGITGNAGYLYIALSSTNQVAEYTRSGTLVGTFGGFGTHVGQMRTPQGLAFGPDGDLYVVEENNNRVSQWSVPPAPVTAPPIEAYTAVTPYRICDTRPVGGAILANQCNDDSTGAGSGPIAQGATRVITVDGMGPVPSSGVTAVVVNVTAVDPTKNTYLSVNPDGVTTNPTTSNLNPNAGTVLANLVQVGVSTAGKIDVYNNVGTTNVILDIEGYVDSSTAGLYTPATSPVRICDTRASGNGIAPNLCDAHGLSPIGPGQTLTFPVNAIGSPVPAAVSAVVFNLTAINPTISTVLTAFAGSGSRPNASNLNIAANAVLPNRVIVPVTCVSGTCTASIWNSVGSVNIAVDIDGWFTTTSGAGFTALATPARVCDTRIAMTNCRKGIVAGGDVVNVDVAGIDGIPVDTGDAGSPVAIVANVTAVNATMNTYVSVYPGPASTNKPDVSDVNPGPNQTATNLVVVGIGSDGSINLFDNVGGVDLIVDVVGYYALPVA